MAYNANHQDSGWIWVGHNQNYKNIENPYHRNQSHTTSSLFITNFPIHVDAKHLWKTCEAYGRIVDAFIPKKLSKSGKRFGFVRFQGVYNEEDMASKLSFIWIGSFHLFAAISRFSRSNKPKFDHKSSPVHIPSSIKQPDHHQPLNTKEAQPNPTKAAPS
ncbi:RNA-directed DNA polymerase, eukaryota, reverse transcriptase zinc-binding domain protein [Tanacetum coccineum]